MFTGLGTAREPHNFGEPMEISEYVVTDNINENFQRLLKGMQSALQGGGGHDIGVWVSGFYGSGKSSFTKYLGFALDRGMKLGSDGFLQLLKNRITDPQVPALFNQVLAVYDPVVIFLDLASEMLAGASMEDISTVLYLKVLQWAGYSEDLKVAELERMLEKDGQFAAFKKRAAVELDGTEWHAVHNQPLVANPIAARLASVSYPKRVTSTEDPLQTVTHAGGRAQIRSDRKALVSIKDYLGETGQVEGRRLLEHFNEPPFGWSKDTTRYLLAALFVVMDVKFRIAARNTL
jgi:hypothetical protein